jgi:pilus assembly protein FimV
MAFGFGFNKAKVLASAEKFVQQGKLQNAITEYEKVVEKDAKDLTVLNTIGDLYARLGQNEKAGEYFKRVGDNYATDGFTVKAIAMYKKLTKLNLPGSNVAQRLAELYTQQGLYNDARQQYLLLADQSIKSNDLNGAAKIFQKMLEIDPDNSSLQSKLADLYVKMGKKDEARDIFLRAATSLYDRGAVEQADQALDRLISLDPGNAEALLMRGKISMDAGDGAAAARYLEKIPNIDSKPDGLQSLLRAQILTNNAEGAEAVARKLATVHNDLSGIRQYAGFLLAGGNAEAALNIHDEFADRLLVGDTGELVFALQGLTGQVKDNPESLEKLRRVFEKAGATGNIPEINELLAHAYVQRGELAKARDLYKELADLEPSNPVHMQNYKQVMVKLGEDASARPLTAAQADQAFFVEEIEAPPVSQEYQPALKEEIDTVLSEAELFESYNKPGQAVKPLESIRAKAPNDARINQRLLSVYQKLGRLQDAANCCDTLRRVYEQFGIAKQSKQYGTMATQLRQQAGVPEPPAAVAAIPVEAAPTSIEEMAVAAPTVQEITPEAFAAGAAQSDLPALPADAGEAHEIDLSAEWEAATTEPAAEQAEFGVAPATEFDVAPAEASPSVVADLLEEIRFYLSQSMWAEARSALSRCEQADPQAPGLAELKQQLEAGTTSAPTEEMQVEVEQEAPAVAPESEAAQASAEEATISEYDFESMTEVAAEPPAFEVAPPAPEPAAEMAVARAEESAATDFEAAVPKAGEPAPFEIAAESAPAEEIPIEPPAQEVHIEEAPIEAAPAAKPVPEPPVAAAASKDVLSDMVLDLESALGEDFGALAPKTTEAPPIAAAAAASVTPAPVAAVPTAPAPPEPVAALTPEPEPEPVLSQAETSSALSDLFEEFKEEVGEPASEEEDPETHYNLGVAFKEMGLLDEAIGELQKVCKSIERGVPFSQTMQAYTWLANCFVEKGVPLAGVKWYEKALTIPSSDESRTALHYDLASAYEAAGDKTSALKHFTEVYGTNIDYRDVTERIKSLKS